eukprot:TRINITY_DN1052_c0_g4_i1.p1 TRINITY_DN1052_c0_g4~~TRINITY_DN1052_c0_g4_i1.p1  ORF type:complete len:499 (-),score=127.36 TRINITY_DN1052_c0_g4_i1:47-1516(-)
MNQEKLQLLEDKRRRVDALVKQLGKDAFTVTKLLADGKPYINELKALDVQIAKIRAAQGHKEPLGSGPRNNPKRDWRPFFKWFRENGFPEVDDYEVVYDQAQGFGLTTKKDLKRGDVVFQVPSKFMMTNVSALESAKPALLIHNDQLLQNVYSLSLSLHLLIEKYELESFWAPYINSLPNVYGSAFYWSAKDLAKLEGSKAHWEISKMKAAVAKQYCHCYFRLEKQLEFAVMKRESFNWDAFLWSITTVFSRQNKILVNGASGRQVEALALIPFFDLINHEGFGELSSEYDIENKCLRLLAVKDLKAGEQITMHYGDRPNIELVLNQGFFVPNNPNSFTTIEMALLSADKLKQQKADILAKHGLPETGSYVLSLETPVPEELIQFLRVAWLSTEEDLAGAERAFHGPVSLQNELQAYVMLSLKLNQVIKGYPTKLEDDLKELEKIQGTQTSNTQNALNLLIEEKKIFNATSAKVAAKIAALRKKISEAK